MGTELNGNAQRHGQVDKGDGVQLQVCVEMNAGRVRVCAGLCKDERRVSEGDRRSV